MSSVPIPASDGTAQLAGQAQARAVADAERDHRRAIASMANSRGGMCLADGWNVSQHTLDGDFAIDAATVDRLLAGAPLPLGPSMSAAPAAGAHPPRRAGLPRCGSIFSRHRRQAHRARWAPG